MLNYRAMNGNGGTMTAQTENARKPGAAGA
jgi:hypothetical protein